MSKSHQQEYSDEFERLWNLYPKRSGDNPKKHAYRFFCARLKEESFQTIEEGIVRYAKFCEATGKVDSEFVMQAQRFFGVTKPYLNDWKVPKNETRQRIDNSVPARIDRANAARKARRAALTGKSEVVD